MTSYSKLNKSIKIINIPMLHVMTVIVYYSEGKLVFPKTKDVDDPKRRHFQAMETDDSSNTSDGALSPQTGGDTSDQSASPCPLIPTPPDITPLLQKLQQSGAGSPVTFTFAGAVPSITSQSFSGSPTSTSTTIAGLKSASISSSSRDSRDKGLRIKKKTPKPPAKSKVIKFHEYKGPPSALKNSSQSSASSTASMSPSPTVTATIASPPGIAVSTPSVIPPPPAGAVGPPPAGATDSTPYNIMLQQQQLFLQWQLEYQQKQMPFILPTPKSGSQTGDSTSASSTPVVTPCATPIPPLSTGTPGPPAVTATPPPVPLAPPVQQTAMVPTNAIKVPAIAASSVGSFTVVPSVLTSSITQPASVPSSISTPTSQTQTVLAPIPLKITKLEDMKVADLKIELKKRNLPVSGPKPQLIERLKQYSETISSKQQQNAISSMSNVVSSTTPSISSISSVSSVSSISSEVSLTSPPSVTNLGNIINIQPVTPQNEDAMSMTMGSPPMSPSNSLLDLNASLPPALSEPTSPENLMDVQSPTNLSLINQKVNKMSSHGLNTSQTLVPVKIEPMKMDASRPPSVVPMEVDLNSSLNLSQPNIAAAVSGTSVTQVVAPISTATLLGTAAPGNLVDHNQNPHTAPPTPQGQMSQPATPQIPTQPPTPVASLPMTPSPAQIIVQTQPQTTLHQGQALQPQTITIQPEVPQLQQHTQSGQIQALPQQQILTQVTQVQQQPAKAATPMSSSLQMAQQIQQIQANLQAVQASMQQAVQQAQLQATNLSQVTASVPPIITSMPQLQTSMPHLQTSTSSLIQAQPQSVPQTAAVQQSVTQSPGQTNVGPQGVMQVQVAPPTVQQPQQQTAPQQQQHPVGQPQVISHEELLRQQQKQIEDLRRQLLMSQQSLQEAQQKALQHQEQLKLHLAQAQAQAQQMGLLPPMAIPSQADTKVSQGQQMVQQPVYAQIQLQPMAQPPPPPPPQPAPSPRPAQTIQQPSPQQGAPVTVIPTTVTSIKSETKPNINTLNSFIQAQAIQQSLIGQNKVLLNVMQQPNGQQVIITSQPNAKVTLANHILNNQNNKINPNTSLTINGVTNTNNK